MTRNRPLRALARLCALSTLITGCTPLLHMFPQGDAMPDNEAQARQLVTDFYQKTLQNLPPDWYWSTAEPGGVDLGDSHTIRVGPSTFSFSATFRLRGEILDTAKAPADGSPVFERVVYDWEKLGWKKTHEKNPENGMRWVNGTTQDGLEVDLVISTRGTLGTRCNVHFHASNYDDGLHSPRRITRDGPAPWTPPTSLAATPEPASTR